RRERAAGVETVPAEPEHQTAERAEDDVVRWHWATTVALEDATETRAEHNRTCQRNHATDGVNNGRTCEVEEASRLHRRQHTAGTPCPVAEDWIDETRHADAVEQVADEARTTDHRAGGNRRAGICEGELEDPEGQDRDAR